MGLDILTKMNEIAQLDPIITHPLSNVCVSYEPKQFQKNELFLSIFLLYLQKIY